MSKQPVILEHDGAIDDFVAIVLLMTMQQYQPLGVIVTPADCYLQAALNVTRKILDLMGHTQVPVAASTVRGINSFPHTFRRDCIIIDHLPILNEKEAIATPLLEIPGQKFLVQTLQAASEPVTLLITGPLTNLATSLEIAPEIESKIKEIIWMGGALNVPGNVEKVFAPEQDGSAEWNAYWDAEAVEKLWKTSIPLILCPLDLTNTVPVTSAFLRRLAKQRRYPLSDLVGQCYALATVQNYFFWDVLAAAYLAHPEFYRWGEYETSVVSQGPSQGRTKISRGGKRVKVLERINKEDFYDYILQVWQA